MPSHADIALPAFDLRGRTALVTGASSGLGARFARVLAAAGAKVALAARRGDRLAAHVDAIAKTGGIAAAVSMDVTQEASIIAAYDEVETLFGQVDTIVNNAGMNMRGLAVEIAAADFDALMAVNVRGVFLVAREGARRMMGEGRDPARGRIVNIASIGAVKVLPGLTPYCTSKAAVAMMTKSLAREWAKHGIAVNAICPGYVETEINAAWLAEAGGQKMIQGFPRRRLMRDEDLDAPLLMLCGASGQFITGAIVTIDDGQSL